MTSGRAGRQRRRWQQADRCPVTVSLLAEAGRAVLRVADDGPGVPAHLRGSVSERFARADSSRSRAAGSTGLGPSIVAAVVQAHGGEISCPPVAVGAVFDVRLPLAGGADLSADSVTEPAG